MKGEILLLKLHAVLSKLSDEAGANFSGLGIIVCDDIKKIPVAPLYTSAASITKDSLYKNLLNLSKSDCPYHDGFHILSSDLEITQTAQYFYPDPIKNFALDSKKCLGSRYYVAQVGSLVPKVLFTAVIGHNYGVCIFKDGLKVEIK